jgi:hypothetical protein
MMMSSVRMMTSAWHVASTNERLTCGPIRKCHVSPSRSLAVWRIQPNLANFCQIWRRFAKFGELVSDSTYLVGHAKRGRGELADAALEVVPGDVPGDLLRNRSTLYSKVA